MDNYFLQLQLFGSLLRQMDRTVTKNPKEMKANVFVMMAAMMLAVSSCTVRIGNGAEILEASENIVKQKYQQASFDKVESHVVGKIQLVQSDKSSVTLSAPENYIDLFEFKNKDGELDIRFTKRNVNFHADNITIIVYSPTFREIENRGAADLHIDNLKTDELEVKNSGVGAFTVKNLDAGKLDVSCSGVGSIKLSGSAEEAEYSCSGVGSIDAKELKAKSVEAKVSGVGGIDCYASDYINGHVTGVGGLKYAGHPSKKELSHGMTGGITEL